MLNTEHTQSLSEFRKSATVTLDRLNQTGDAEIITVDGKARAVLLAPAVYDQIARELEVARDVAVIRKAMKQIDEGNFVTADEFHEQLRGKLLAMKAAQEAGK